MKWLQVESNRAYIYRVALAILALLVAYDVINGDDQAIWAAALEAIFAIGASALATFNTTTSREDG